MPGPVHDLATFASALRGRGLTVTPDQVADMSRVFTLVDAGSRDQVHAALRALAITDPAHRPPFDEEFAKFFEGFIWPPAQTAQHSRLASTKVVKPVIQHLGDAALKEDTNSQAGASTIENLAQRDFADLDADQIDEARRMVMAMTWQPSDTRTRRWTAAKGGPNPDLRRTLQRSVRPDGDLMPIMRRERRIRQRPLIVIADISGSMEKYADLFLVFAHAAQRRLDRVEAFTFSTELTRITEELKRRDIRSAMSGVSTTVHDWSGGTKIGEALGEWNRLWSRRLARGGPVVLILSDGWDTGEVHLLQTEMARMARSVHKVLWLNPLAARAEYAPTTRGMRAVLPYIDELLPAASVHDLRGVVRLLESMSS